MIPIGDLNPRHRTPLVTTALLVANVAVFGYELLLGSQVEPFFVRWGFVPAHLTDPAGHPLAFVTLFTSMFLHGGWMHLLGNMLYLWIFGDNVEDQLGHVRFLLFYLAAGVIAALAQVAAAPDATIPGVGASGAIAGVLGVYLVRFPTARVQVFIPYLWFIRLRPVPAVLVLGLWFVLQLLSGALSLGAGNVAMGGVAWFAHIGGFAAGLFVGVGLRLSGRRRSRWG